MLTLTPITKNEEVAVDGKPYINPTIPALQMTAREGQGEGPISDSRGSLVAA